MLTAFFRTIPNDIMEAGIIDGCGHFTLYWRVMLPLVQYYEVDFGALFAGLVIVMLPTLLCYIILQEQITKGITVGAVKGCV